MKRVFIVVAAVCLFFIPATAFACSCARGDPPSEFNRAKAVFIGRMLGGTEKLSVKDRSGNSSTIEAGKVRFTVDDVFKGEVADEVTIDIASMNGTSCGPYGLQRGAQYVVFAYVRQGDEKTLYTGVCSRTKPAGNKYAKKDLDFLRNLPAAGVGGNLRGRIRADLRAEEATPLPDVMVNIRGTSDQLIRTFTRTDSSAAVASSLGLFMEAL